MLKKQLKENKKTSHSLSQLPWDPSSNINTIKSKKWLQLSGSLKRFRFLFPSIALQREVAETESQADSALHLPPCNSDADMPENVYPLDGRILLIPNPLRVTSTSKPPNYVFESSSFPYENPTVLSPVEFKALEEAGSKMAALTAEELQTMRENGG